MQSELNVEIRNRIQASIIVFERLLEGKEVPKTFLQMAQRDLEDLSNFG